MVDNRGEPIVMDFGLARQAYGEGDIRLTHSGLIIGTPAYMSPEQIEAVPERITASTDQYSLGVILYELLTGELPFRGPLISVIGQIAAKTPKPPSQLRLDLDQRIEAACLRMMAKRPKNRFASMRDVADELATILRTPANKRQGPVESGGSAAAVSHKGKPAAQVPSARNSARDTQSQIALARSHFARHDYDEAVRILEEIPESERSESIRALLNKARELSDEVALIQVEIDEAVQLGDGSIALAKAERLSELKPGHVRIKEIQQKYRRQALPNSGGFTKGSLITLWIAGALFVIGVTSLLVERLMEGVYLVFAAAMVGVALFANYFLVTRHRKHRDKT
jgi:serine/threonine protein kinase